MIKIIERFNIKYDFTSWALNWMTCRWRSMTAPIMAWSSDNNLPFSSLLSWREDTSLAFHVSNWDRKIPCWQVVFIVRSKKVECFKTCRRKIAIRVRCIKSSTSLCCSKATKLWKVWYSSGRWGTSDVGTSWSFR